MASTFRLESQNQEHPRVNISFFLTLLWSHISFFWKSTTGRTVPLSCAPQCTFVPRNSTMDGLSLWNNCFNSYYSIFLQFFFSNKLPWSPLLLHQKPVRWGFEASRIMRVISFVRGFFLVFDKFCIVVMALSPQPGFLLWVVAAATDMWVSINMIFHVIGFEMALSAIWICRKAAVRMVPKTFNAITSG